jgi:hypothetical protein
MTLLASRRSIHWCAQGLGVAMTAMPFSMAVRLEYFLCQFSSIAAMMITVSATPARWIRTGSRNR